MRIVAGKFRGKNLVKSDHLKLLRPTTDKNREALFNILSSPRIQKEIGFQIIDSEVLDICCGTGAVGFEALSRGAKSANFIDVNPSHLALVKKNSEILAVESSIKISCLDAKNLPQNEKSFDLVFVDPPYVEDYQLIMQSLFKNGWINQKSLVVVELSSKADAKNIILENFKLLELRSYGKTSFAFLIFNAA